MKVEIWSDVVCPWCYIGKRRFERALESFAHRDEVEVVWHSFQLDPDAPARVDDPLGELAAKYGITREQVQDMHDEISEVAAGEGLGYRLDQAIPGNTFDAHRLIHLAAEHGLADAAEEALFAAHFLEGEAIGERETLLRLGTRIGLAAGEVQAVLDSGRYAAQVRADLAEAAALGIRGVPFFVLDRKFGVSGAQPAAQLVQALEQAWDAAHPASPLTVVGEGAGPGCEGDSCAV